MNTDARQAGSFSGWPLDLFPGVAVRAGWREPIVAFTLTRISRFMWSRLHLSYLKQRRFAAAAIPAVFSCAGRMASMVIRST